MRNFLTTKDISRLSGYSRAQIWNRAKAGEIPGERVKYSGKRLRFIDSPEIRSWCEERRFGLIALEWSVIEGTVLAVIERDYRDNPDKIVFQEIQRRLAESDDPDQLLKKWERAMRAGKREDLPRIDLSRLGSDILGEILRQLVDSKNPKQLLRKWARALLDGRFEDLPHAL
jgi:predicted DNA-binding transcriptional regulator AlpA